MKIKRETLARYLQILEDAKIVSKCARFDLKSRKSPGRAKVLPSGPELLLRPQHRQRINYGPVLENIVYRYARAQGCKVSVGRIGKLECDFILRNPQMGYRVCSGGYDHHGRPSNGGARIPSVPTDQGQLPQVPAYAKRPHPAARWHHPCQHSRVHAVKGGPSKGRRPS